MTPSLRIGRQWLTQVARSDGPVVNIHAKTIYRIAVDLIKDAPDVQNRRMLNGQGAVLLVQKIWRDQRGKSSFLGALTPSLGLFQKLAEVIESMRMAEIQAEDIHCSYFDSRQKGEEMRDLLSRYERMIHRENLLDRADIFRLALSVENETAARIFERITLLLPETLELCGLERRLIDRFSPERIRRLAAPDWREGLERTDPPRTDLEALRRLPRPGEAPKPPGDGSAAIFRSIGECNEIREVFRRCFSEKISLDAAELLYTDGGVYIPQLYENALLIFGESDSPPVTFAEGLPVRYSRPGRLLKCWLSWMRSDYQQSLLARFLEDDLIDMESRLSNGVTKEEMIRQLRSMMIVFGKARHLKILKAKIESDRKRLEEALPSQALEDLESSAYYQSIRHSLQISENLFKFLKELLDASPASNARPIEQLSAARLLLSQFANCATELDRNSRNRLLEEIDNFAEWIETDDDAASIDIIDWLASLPDEIQVLASGPREGCLHAAPLQQGGHSGRLNTFIVGLDEGRFPGAGAQDPFLLDEERERLSDELLTASSRQQKKLDSFYNLIHRLEGKLTLSYSSYHLSDDREIFPSAVILNAFRILSGNPEGDLSDLERGLPEPASFAPPSAEKCLTESEFWLYAMSVQAGRRNSLPCALQRHPHWKRGMEARQARMSVEFTRYDGWTPKAGVDLDPTQPQGVIMSASRFETLGQCPLRFFFQVGLKLEPPEEIDMDANVWLNPLDYGSLVHELFEKFYQELIDKKEKPSFDKHWDRLQEILRELVQKYQELSPPPNESAFKQQMEQLKQCANIFLRDEESLCEIYSPVYVEASIGIPNKASCSQSSFANPQPVRLPGGKEFYARGIIDRVDRIEGEGDLQFAIWDYKSGGTYRYNQSKPFQQGRVIQHSLYYELMNQWLKSTVDPKAELCQFGYFFSSGKGKGERYTWTASELTERGNIFSALCRIISEGIFLPTDKEDDCRFCDYRTICGNVAAVTRSSRGKLQNPLNTRLQPIKELRNDEK
ncbi:MAG: PD-(D/E)XK nuclease family protein [Candidatus Omnitrophica bacterium]|nr:PD-(D/E)XK nuclease family protein [Candidatus Omnitrophota bacterium]